MKRVFGGLTALRATISMLPAFQPRNAPVRWCVRGVLPALVLTWPVAGRAEEAIDDATTYKLTLSHYGTESIRGDDVNLRLNRGDHTAWLAYYREAPAAFQQLRTGYERTDAWGGSRLVTSLQAASRGFFGGALTAQLGDPWFALIGFGRTNLKPYVNLNFDPNDAVSLGAGWHGDKGVSVTAFVVRDDRVVPGQQIAHVVGRAPLPGGNRLTVDLFDKRGPAPPGQSIRGAGAALTMDLPQVFMRVAYDPKVNFSQENMTRISFGMRF